MADGFRIVDYKTWKRSVHCEVFRNHMVPQYCVSLELDITNFLEKIKKQGYSFTFAMTYAAARCANQIEEFRYRFMDGQVVLYDRIDTSFTYLDKETELFKVVEVELMDTMEKYVKAAGEAVRNQKEYFTGPPGNNVFQFSAMPWISYTHISHTESGKKDNATPLFDWGKYFKRDGRILLPFSVQVHHSFVDGLHIGKLAEVLQDYLDQYGRNYKN